MKNEVRADKIDRTEFMMRPRRPLMLVLDGVRQHYNLGAVFRLCDAFLVRRLIIAGKALQPRNRKFVQAARGTFHWVPWVEVDDASAAVMAARSDGWQIVVVEQTSRGVTTERLAAKFPVCLVLGSERDGVSPDIVDIAAAAITIPMLGMANSINVATAAAIVLHSLSVLYDRQSA